MLMLQFQKTNTKPSQCQYYISCTPFTSTSPNLPTHQRCSSHLAQIPLNPFAFIHISCWSMFNKQVGLHKTNFQFKTFHTNFYIFIINPFTLTHILYVSMFYKQCLISIYFHIENLGKNNYLNLH